MSLYSPDTPILTPSCFAWFDASDLSLGAVASWPDKSGFQRHAVQATGVRQMTCTANLRVGKNAVVGSRTNTTFAVSTFGVTTTSDCTIFYAVQKLSLTTGGTNDFIFDGIEGTNRQEFVDLASNSTFTFGTATITSGASTDTNAHIHVMQGGTTGNYWIDGVAQFTNTDVGSLGAAGLTINGRYSGTNASDSNIYEVIYYNRKLTTTERNVIQQYLSNKWGITTA